MASSCDALFAALKDCLLHSDCVLKQGHLPSACIRDHLAELPEECQSLRKALFECKRGMVRRLGSLPFSRITHAFQAGYAEPVSREHCRFSVRIHTQSTSDKPCSRINTQPTLTPELRDSFFVILEMNTLRYSMMNIFSYQASNDRCFLSEETKCMSKQRNEGMKA